METDVQVEEKQGTIDQEQGATEKQPNEESTIKPDELESEQKTEEEKKQEQNNVAQEKINKVINRKHRQMREAEEEADRQKKHAEALQVKLDELNKTTAPEIPDLPDPYDAEYDKKMVVRDAAIEARTKYDQEQFYNQQKQRTIEQANLDKQQKQAYDNVRIFRDRVQKLGIKEEDIRSAENTVAGYIQSQDVRDFLLQDENGVLMVQYLADNLVELEAISRLTPMAAAIRLTTKVAPEAKKLLPKQTQTPDPLTIENGRNKTDTPDPMIQGATFN